MNPKLCVDCKHHYMISDSLGVVHLCDNWDEPDFIDISVVTGKATIKSGKKGLGCELARSVYGPCYVSARGYEQK